MRNPSTHPLLLLLLPPAECLVLKFYQMSVKRRAGECRPTSIASQEKTRKKKGAHFRKKKTKNKKGVVSNHHYHR